MMFQTRRLLIATIGALAVATLAGCGAAQTSSSATAPTPTSGATHTEHSASAANPDAPFDARFIDGMIMHHQGAITMAKDAQTEAEHPEIKTLAGDIITAQQAEIAQLQAWRGQWYPDLAPTGGMAMDMGAMSVAAGSAPFDQRFMQAMIPHHQSAISMAKDAQAQSEHAEIKTLADAIVTTQGAEIAQMQQWLSAWYNVR